MSVDTFDAEPWDVYSGVQIRRARKDHFCSACGETIHRGDLYSYTFGVFDGATEQVKRCARCELIFRHLDSLTGPDEAVDRELNCGHTYEYRHGEPPPEDIAALAFALRIEAQAQLLKQERGK